MYRKCDNPTCKAKLKMAAGEAKSLREELNQADELHFDETMFLFRLLGTSLVLLLISILMNIYLYWDLP